ncbi:FecR domain-containing protein [Haliea sp. E1-2-M8]|uniref:FecR family protein n=1 Tax=Haliea sp. E1-2-M8 TaxID=3064706 RepID=UPI00271EBE63|nr:FecR domain-containing protein [Haliea sp. E1-2-M8]MDO8864032.1 FecR domain-containing protein [Haliea sp. E1-2-M8]
MTAASDRGDSAIRPVSEAAYWYEKVSAGDLSDTDMARFEQWLLEPGNEADYANCALLWNAAEVPEFWTGGPAEVAPAVRRGALSRGYGRWVALAASLVLLVSGALLWPIMSAGDRYQTVVGEQRLVVLADESSVFLNTNTVLEVSYTGKSRRVRLDRGEAIFDVRPDAERPFEVQTGAGTVRVVGTRFALRSMENERVRLAVSEGRVTVSPRDSTRAEPSPVLTAGEILDFNSRGVSSRDSDVDVETLLQWRSGVISFSGEALPAVIREVSRYTSTSIEFRGKDLSGLRVSGIFRVGEVDAFLEGLAAAFPVAVVHAADGGIVITAT